MSEEEEKKLSDKIYLKEDIDKLYHNLKIAKFLKDRQKKKEKQTIGTTLIEDSPQLTQLNLQVKQLEETIKGNKELENLKPSVSNQRLEQQEEVEEKKMIEEEKKKYKKKIQEDKLKKELEIKKDLDNIQFLYSNDKNFRQFIKDYKNFKRDFEITKNTVAEIKERYYDNPTYYKEKLDKVNKVIEAYKKSNLYEKSQTGKGVDEDLIDYGSWKGKKKLDDHMKGIMEVYKKHKPVKGMSLLAAPNSEKKGGSSSNYKSKKVNRRYNTINKMINDRFIIKDDNGNIIVNNKSFNVKFDDFIKFLKHGTNKVTKKYIKEFIEPLKEFKKSKYPHSDFPESVRGILITIKNTNINDEYDKKKIKKELKKIMKMAELGLKKDALLLLDEYVNIIPEKTYNDINDYITSL